jgi:hypothetical protein
MHEAARPSILVIGGPAGEASPSDAFALERIGCDVASILAHPASKKFYSYSAVVLWLDGDYLRMSATFGEWEARREAGALPRLHPEYWEILRLETLGPESRRPATRRANFAGLDGPPAIAPERSSVEDKPMCVVDCRLIADELHARCERRLRDIIHGTARTVLAYAVVTGGTPARRHGYEWISRHLSIGRHADDSVYVNHSGSDSAGIRQDLERIMPIVSAPWPWTFDLMRDEEGNKSRLMGRLQWGDHWFGRREDDDLWDDGGEQDDFSDRLMMASLGHVNGAGQGKSLLFRTRVDSESAAANTAEVPWADGYLLAMPEPESLDRLVACIGDMLKARVIKSEGDLARALVTPTVATPSPPPTPPPTIKETEVLDLCRTKPNEAFLSWQAFEAELTCCPQLECEKEREFRAMRDTFRKWFEDLGHWRDLRPKSKDLDPDDHNAHAKHQKQIEDFMAARQSRLRPIEYDETRNAHKCQHEGTEHEDVEYIWEFFRDGASQLILRTAGCNDFGPDRDPPKRQYFKNTPPSGYAILESEDKLEGTVFFPNGDYCSLDPCFGDENQLYPEELLRAGDYELRKVGRKGTTLEAVHADMRETKEIVSRLPGAIADVEKDIGSMQPHLRGVPKVLADLKEAKLVPEDATRELFTQIQNVLAIEQQHIWTAVRNAGTQKGAIALLREHRIDLSEATLSRRVQEIDEELKKHGLPPCKASGPRIRFTKSGGYTNDKGKTVPEELSEPDRDWADDPKSRDNTIRLYLASSEEESVRFQQLYFGIEDEAEEYKKHGGMKSD